MLLFGGQEVNSLDGSEGQEVDLNILIICMNLMVQKAKKVQLVKFMKTSLMILMSQEAKHVKLIKLVKII